MIPLRILGALLLPVGVALAYAPLHKGWLVQWFGCICSGKKGFSASTLSFLIHGAVAVWAGVLVWNLAQRLPLRSRMNAVSVGLIVLGAGWFYFWQRDCAIG